MKKMKSLEEQDKQQAREIIASKLDLPIGDILDDANLTDELDSDLMDIVEIIMEFEQVFDCNIPDALAAKVITVSDLYDCLTECIQ